MAVYTTHITKEQGEDLIGRYREFFGPWPSSLGPVRKIALMFDNDHRWEYKLPKTSQTEVKCTGGVAPGNIQMKEVEPMLKVKRYTETKKPLPIPPFLASDDEVTVLFVTLRDGMIVEPVSHPKYRVLQILNAEYYKPFSGSLEMVV